METYLVLNNISKRPNLIKLINIAVATGCHKILMVGQPTFDVPRDVSSLLKNPQTGDVFWKNINNNGKDDFIIRFQKWKELVEYLQKHDISLVGIEIHPKAVSLEDFVSSSDYHPTNEGRKCAFLPGNEGTGLNQKQMKACDTFVQLPQYGVGTASLNVYVATSIVLNRVQELDTFLSCT